MTTTSGGDDGQQRCPGCGTMPCAGTVPCLVCSQPTRCRPWAPRQQCVICGMLIAQECQRQMRARSGPVYALVQERSKLASAAWRAAGSPLRVTRLRRPVRDADGAVVLDADGSPRYEDRWYLAASMRVGRRRSRKYAGLVEATPEQVAKWLAYQDVRPSFEPVPGGLTDDHVRLARQRTGDPLENAAARHRRIREAADAGDPATLEAVHAMQALDDEWPYGLPEEASDQEIARYEAALRRYFVATSAPLLSGEDGRRDIRT